MKDFIKTKGLLFLFMFALIIGLPGYEKTFSAQQQFPSFTGIVKKEKNAVVNVSTTSIVNTPPGSVDPFQEFFGDEFLKRFFGQIPQQEQKRQSLGSGFIISRDGDILTNYHVVENATEIVVKLNDEREFKAKVIGKDPKTDIALVRIEGELNLPTVSMGDSDRLEVGEWVLAIGNPFGVGQTVTAGIVSAKGREIGAGPYDDFIQTDASINPGNSGGPLFNLNGDVIGINSAIVSPSGGNVGIGFAIPINLVKSILQELKLKGHVTRGWLGVNIQAVTNELADKFKLPSREGALIAHVVKDSPADKAGIRRGDVIVEFDGRKVTKVRDLPTLVAAVPINKRVKISLYRDGKQKHVTAKIEKMEEKREMIASEAEKGKLGLSVQEVTTELAGQLNLGSTKGVIITMVEAGSPAERGDLQRGDVIYEINRMEINTMDDYNSAVNKIEKGEDLLILISREGNIFYLVMKAE